MANPLNSCTVSRPRECNHATPTTPNETSNETSKQLSDLLALAQSVLDKNKCNNSCNQSATYWLHKDNVCQQSTLRKLINTASQNYGGDNPIFLANYVDYVLSEWSHDLDKALACFNAVADQNPLLITGLKR